MQVGWDKQWASRGLTLYFLSSVKGEHNTILLLLFKNRNFYWSGIFITHKIKNRQNCNFCLCSFDSKLVGCNVQGMERPARAIRDI